MGNEPTFNSCGYGYGCGIFLNFKNGKYIKFNSRLRKYDCDDVVWKTAWQFTFVCRILLVYVQ